MTWVKHYLWKHHSVKGGGGFNGNSKEAKHETLFQMWMSVLNEKSYALQSNRTA